MKILYINTSYDFSCGVNAMRPYDLLSYFSKRKVSVTHLTPFQAFQFPYIRNVIVPYSYKKHESMYVYFLKSLVSVHNEDRFERWVDDVKDYLISKYHGIETFDAVLINIQPVCLLKIGQFLKKQYGLKVIVDMHDSFAYSPYRTILPVFDKKLQMYERTLFSNIDVIITLVPSMKRMYQNLYKNTKVLCIPHAISDNPYKLDKPIVNSNMKKTYSIAYGGSLFGGRELFILLDALRSLKNNVFTVTHIGNISIVTKIRYFKYGEVQWHSSLTRSEYLRFLSDKIDIGVVCQGFRLRHPATSAIAAKTYEYLYYNKPIIYIGPEGDNSDFIKTYSNNFILITQPKYEKRKLMEYLQEFRFKRQNTKPKFYRLFKASHVYKIFFNVLKNSIEKDV